MIAYDLETCLMKKGKKRQDVLILSIGAVDILQGRTFHCYVNPLSSAKNEFLLDLETYGVQMKPTETVITNIHWRHEKAKPLPEALTMFETFIHGATQIMPKPVIIAHNGRSFDHKILLGSYRRLDQKIPDLCYLDSWHDIKKRLATATLPQTTSFTKYVAQTLCCRQNGINTRRRYGLIRDCNCNCSGGGSSGHAKLGAMRANTVL